jgi:hypothetical protein
MDGDNPDRFLMMRYGSNRNEMLDSTFESSVMTDDDEEDVSFESDRTETDEILRTLSSKVRGWRKTSMLALKLQKKSDPDMETGSERHQSMEPKRGSFTKIGKVLNISKKHHERLNAVIFHRADRQLAMKKEANLFESDLTDTSKWTMCENPMFQKRVDHVSEEEKSEA